MTDERKPIDADFTEEPGQGQAPPPPPPPAAPPSPADGGEEPPGGDGKKGKKGKKPPKKPRVFSTGRAVFGLIVIGIGVLILLEQLGLNIDHPGIIFGLGLIVFGVLKVLGPQPASSKFFGIAAILIGALLLLGTFDTLWPLLIILLGFHILWRAVGKKGVRQMGSTSSTADFAKEFVVFGSSEKILKTQRFKGGEFTAIFGGVELDLRDAQIEPGQDAVIDCFVVFGGVELRVPENWEVVNEASAIFGGVEEKSVAGEAVDDARRLHIKGYVFFGGLEIRN